VGFGMGDVVLTNVLQDKGLVPEEYAPRPDAFVIALNDDAATLLPKLVADLRQAGIHTRFSYKATRNVGKLLKDATQNSARYAVILDENTVERKTALLKNLNNGEQKQVPVNELTEALHDAD